MARKAAFNTVIAAVRGAGALSAFPVSAQESTSETTTVTANRPNQYMDSQMTEMMGNMTGTNHGPVATQEIDTQMANMIGSNHRAMTGDHAHMENRDMSGDTPTSNTGRQSHCATLLTITDR